MKLSEKEDAVTFGVINKPKVAAFLCHYEGTL